MINDLQEITTAYYKGLLTPNEYRVMLGLNLKSCVKSMAIRRAVACTNCGSTQYENGICSFCGTIYEEGDEK